MAGKSGTAEAPPNEPHAWFVGYAPAYDPQIAVAVVLEHGGEGGANAAPLFRQVVEAYMALPRD
jgi:peptidoglycan glycosyltransferase